MKRRTLLGSVALAATIVAASDAPRPEPAADESLLGSVRVVASRIAAIVHVDRAPGVLALRAPEATRVAEATARAERVLPPGIAAARGRAWRDLGLGSEAAPRELVAAIESDLSGMTFDAERKRLLVDPERLQEDAGHGDPSDDPDASVLLATGVAPDEPVAGHYVAHALLDPPRSDATMTTDAILARAAFAEGSANLAALILLFGGVGLESEVVAGGVHPEDALGGRLVSETMRSASPVVAHLLEFVYLDGFAQAALLAKQGGFPRLAQERARRVATRDVLHVDRLAAPAVALPEAVLPAGLGLVIVDRDTLGEQGIVTLVSLLTGKDNLGLIAGDGWVADVVSRFEPSSPGAPSGDAGATVWTSRWKTDEDAADFDYALGRCLQSRFPGENPVDDPDRGGRVLARADRVYRMEKRGSEVAFRVATPEIDAKLGPPPKKKGPARPPASPKK